MKENKTKQILEITQTLILLIPMLMLDMVKYIVNKIETKCNAKIAKYLVIFLKTIEFTIATPFVVVYYSLKYLNKYIETNANKKLIKEDAEFQEFAKSNFTKEWLTDSNVVVQVSLKPSDFNNDMYSIYKEYKKAVKIKEEVETNVSKDIVHGLSLLNTKIHIFSESVYNDNNLPVSAGCYNPMTKSIYIKLKSDIEEHFTTLYHEIAHFVDWVIGVDGIGFDYYYSQYDVELLEAFSAEVEFLRNYARTDYQEFFAVAYEHKITNGNMKNLSKTNKVIDLYLKMFKQTIDEIEIFAS